MTLHITDGESVAGTLRESGVSGEVAIYGDLLYEGPAPHGLSVEAWREIRAQFMTADGRCTVEEARHYLRACDDALESYSRYAEVVLWLDHRLSDQLILIKTLDWFSRQNREGVKLSLICIGHYPGIDRFVGMGQLTVEQLASLTGTRLPVRDAHFRTAQTAWSAFTSPDPTAIEQFLETDTSALPFLANAMRRHLEQFPSAVGGLSRTERQALSVLSDRGSLTAGRLFFAVQQLEEHVFMGDASFYRILRELAAARHPLLHMSNAGQSSRAELTITEAGRNVLEGRADQIELNGIDRWLGGVHLNGDQSRWHWDRLSSRLKTLD